MRLVTFPYKTYRGTTCPIISVGIKGPAGWIQAEAYVDTGASVSIFSMNEALGLGLDYHRGKETLVTVGDGGLIPVYVQRLPIQIGTVVFPAAVGFSPRLGVGFNLLGRQDIFARFDVTFSDTRKHILFRPVS